MHCSASPQPADKMIHTLSKLAISAVFLNTALASPIIPPSPLARRDNWTPPDGLNVTYMSEFNS